MPLLEVEIVSDADPPPGLARRLADAAASALGSRPGGTWVRLRALPPDAYAEDGGGEPDVRPVFVRVIERAVPGGDALRERVRALTDAIARACDRPADNVHVIYEPPGAGRVAFGGRIVK